MPSTAYEFFETNLEYVNSIKIGSYKRVKGVQIGVIPSKSQQRNRRKRQKFNHAKELNHANRAALIILCGSWQQYIEDVVCHSRDVFIESMSERLNPREGQGMPGSSMAIWETAYQKHTKQAINDFRSPTCKNIDILLGQSIGVTYKVFSHLDSSADGKRLDAIIRTRNIIVHRGVQHGKYTTLQTVNESMGIIGRLATKTDNYLLSQLTNMHPKKSPPWDGTAE